MGERLKVGDRWLWALSFSGRVGGAAFKVLSILAYRAMDGTCNPKHATIATDTGLSVGGVRKGLAELEAIGAISVSGAGGRSADDKGIACIYHLNMPQAGQVNVLQQGQVNVPQNDGVRATESGGTCPENGGYVSQAGQQKRRLKEIEKENEKDSAPIGAVSSSPSSEGERPASEWQLKQLARLARQVHPGLKFVPADLIIEAIQGHSRQACEWAWTDCDRYALDGVNAEAFEIRFNGRPNGSGGWDHYRPQPNRDGPMRSVEASAWIDDLKQATAQPRATASKYARVPGRTKTVRIQQ